ncbi:MAG: aldehyde dehydrogenase family protein [Bacteroidota bacterium]
MNIADLMMRARVAQIQFEVNFNQCQVDAIVKTVARTVYDNAELLSRLAVEETEMGVYEDKVAKCKGKSKGVWFDLRNKPSMGVISHDPVTNLMEIAKPIGVVAGITPMTNPVVTPMSKIMFALKTKNAIIIAPHPKAKKCSSLTVKMINEAISRYKVPEGLVQVIEEPSVELTRELMQNCDVVVATGGMNMVKSAYSSGKPSYGVGAGNVQVILDREIDFDDAARKIIIGRTFDNGIICSGEQSFIYHKEDRETVMKAFVKNGAFLVDDSRKADLVNAIFENGHMRREAVGKSAIQIAQMAGISVPETTRVLVVNAHGIGPDDIVCKEKMCPVLAAFPYQTIEEAISIAKINLQIEGNGHTAGIHSNNQENILKAGSSISVSRFIVNAPCATTAGGNIQNGLPFTNTLGCGTWGNNSISENFTYKHLLNITRVASLSPNVEVPSDDVIWS